MVAYVKPNSKQKEEIYGQLLNVTDIKTFDRKAFSETRKIPSSTLGGMISQTKNQPNVYAELRKEGFKDAQIPGWVARPARVGRVGRSVARPCQETC